MRDLAKIRLDQEGAIAASAAILRRVGKSEAEVESTVADLFKIHEAGARRALKRLLESSLFAHDLRRELDDEVFDDEISPAEVYGARRKWTTTYEVELEPLRLAAHPGGDHGTVSNRSSEAASQTVRRVTIGGQEYDLSLGDEDDIVLAGTFDPTWRALEAEGVRYDLREDAGHGRRRVKGLGRNGFDLAEAGASAGRPRFVS